MKTGNSKNKKAVEVGPQEYLETTPEALKEKYNLKPEDLNFIVNKEKTLNPSVIGWNKYAALLEKRQTCQRFNDMHPEAKPQFLTVEEDNQIEEYEKLLLAKELEISEKNSEYFAKEKEKPQFIQGVPLDKSNLWSAFLTAFQIETGRKFIRTTDNVKNLECIIKYFTRDETFFECEHLVKNIQGVELHPDFGKGLLLIGSYGNGKSTMMKCFSMILDHNAKVGMEKKWDNTAEWLNRRFSMAYCHNMVVTFDGLEEPHQKSEFFNKYRVYRYCFDDLTKEDLASNYGRKEILRVVLENRYDAKSQTHATLNYPDGKQGDLKAALAQMGVRYGGHIYDRAYQMFNIIDFRGKSFRK